MKGLRSGEQINFLVLHFYFETLRQSFYGSCLLLLSVNDVYDILSYFESEKLTILEHPQPWLYLSEGFKIKLKKSCIINSQLSKNRLSKFDRIFFWKCAPCFFFFFSLYFYCKTFFLLSDTYLGHSQAKKMFLEK